MALATGLYQRGESLSTLAARGGASYTTDGRRTWTTVGVGTNVVEASWEALHDSYLWGLIER